VASRRLPRALLPLHRDLRAAVGEPLGRHTHGMSLRSPSRASLVCEDEGSNAERYRKATTLDFFSVFLPLPVCGKRRVLYVRADAPRRLRQISRPPISSQCGLEGFWMCTCFRHICLVFFEKRSWNRTFVGKRRLVWGASAFPKAPAKSFSRRTAANSNLLLRVKVPLCKDFSV